MWFECIRFECVSCLMTLLIERSRAIYKHLVTCLSVLRCTLYDDSKRSFCCYSDVARNFQLIHSTEGSANKTWANWFSLLSFVAAFYALSHRDCVSRAKPANKVDEQCRVFCQWSIDLASFPFGISSQIVLSFKWTASWMEPTREPFIYNYTRDTLN